MSGKLDLFKRWRDDTRRRLENLGYSTEVFNSPQSDNLSARLDFRGAGVQATIACWESGNIAVEAYSDAKAQFFEHQGDADEEKDIQGSLDKYLDRLLAWFDS
ncbi:MAG: hypothetical protein AAF830_04790 [Pseudomonadota bacterium]